MKIQVRRGVFETNSSSVHTITICTEDEYQKWREGDYIYNRWDRTLVPYTEETNGRRFMTYEQFFDTEFETFESNYTTPSGEKIIAFGYYGYDG